MIAKYPREYFRNWTILQRYGVSNKATKSASRYARVKKKKEIPSHYRTAAPLYLPQDLGQIFLDSFLNLLILVILLLITLLIMWLLMTLIAAVLIDVLVMLLSTIVLRVSVILMVTMVALSELLRHLGRAALKIDVDPASVGLCRVL